MRSSPRSVGRFTALVLASFAVVFSHSPSVLASAYNAHPKLVLVIVIDQFRGDYLERYRDQFGEGGFRLFLDHGAYFSNCFYNYDTVNKLHIPAANLAGAKLDQQLNAAIGAKFFAGKAGRYARFSYPLVWLDNNAFLAAQVREEDAEKAVGEAMKNLGIRDYYTKSQLAEGAIRNDELGRQYLNSYSPLGSWFVMGVPNIYNVGSTAGTDHASPYNYDTHVPLAFYGVPFHPGTYRDRTEPIDMAPTLASLLGINPPTHSVGRVLTEALAPHSTASSGESRP